MMIPYPVKLSVKTPRKNKGTSIEKVGPYNTLKIQNDTSNNFIRTKPWQVCLNTTLHRIIVYDRLDANHALEDSLIGGNFGYSYGLMGTHYPSQCLIN